MGIVPGLGRSSLVDDEDPLISGINVTPLIDIVLVLLLVMMVTAAYVIGESIPLDVSARAAPSEEEPPTIEVALDADARLSIDGISASYRELRARARALGPEGRAIIRADEAAPHGAFVRVIDTLRAGGVDRYAVAMP
jgi:biopolymer transport protein ExbD